MSNFQSYYSCFSLSRDETTMHNTGYFFTRRCAARLAVHGQDKGKS